MKIRILPLALALLALSSCGSKPAGQLTPVRIAMSQGTYAYLPMYIAESLGFWRQEGLAVTILGLPGNSKSMEAMLSGSADVMAGYYEQAIQLVPDGRSIRSFVLMQRSPEVILVVSPASAKTIGKIEDLKGATVGVPALGNASHLFLQFLLAQHGMSTQDVSVVAIPNGAAQVLAIERGKVNACVLGTAYFMLQKRNPEMRVLADTTSKEGVKQTFGMDGYPAAALLADAAWLERNPDTAARMARATLLAMMWMREHSPQEVLDKLPANLRMEDAEADRQTIERVTSTLSPDGMISAEDAAGVKKVLSISLEKVRNTNIDLSKTYTNQYVTAK